MAADGNGGTTLSDEQVERYAKNRGVLYVGGTRVILTLGLRQEAYDAWEADPRPAVIRQVMLDAGIDEREIGRGIACALAKSFRQYGRPTRSNAPTRGSERLVRGAGWYLEHPGEEREPVAAGTSRDDTEAAGACREALVATTSDKHDTAVAKDAGREAVADDEKRDAAAVATDETGDAAEAEETGHEALVATDPDAGTRHGQGLTDEQVSRYAQNPGVLWVGPSCLILTLGLRRAAYDAWEADPRPDAVRAVL